MRNRSKQREKRKGVVEETSETSRCPKRRVKINSENFCIVKKMVIIIKNSAGFVEVEIGPLSGTSRPPRAEVLERR